MIYRITMVTLALGTPKEVIRNYEFSNDLEALKYCNRLNQDGITYGVVYYIRPEHLSGS